MNARRKRKSKKIWKVAKGIARRYAVLFGLELRRVKRLKKRYRDTLFGYCTDDGVVAIGIDADDESRHHPYVVMQTIAHELAHLKHFSHGPAWFALYGEIFARMGADGCYKKLRRAYERD